MNDLFAFRVWLGFELAVEREKERVDPVLLTWHVRGCHPDDMAGRDWTVGLTRSAFTGRGE